MEGTVRWSLVTAIAPVAWGANYLVTHAFLPADTPLYGGAVRALPAGLLLLAVSRQRPRGSWWWKSLVLGATNMGAFFALVYLAAQLLPASVAATIMATSPAVMMLFAWALLSLRPTVLPIAGAVVGLLGVVLMLGGGGGTINPVGVLASLTAMVMTAVGFVLAKKWAGTVDLLASTSWQLIAGGLMLLPFAVAREGAPPPLDLAAVLALVYVIVIATAVAYAAWFAGLRHLTPGTVGLIGLLNPVTGVLLGTMLAGETLSPQQLVGVVLVLVGVLLGQPIVAQARDRWRAASVDQVADHRVGEQPPGVRQHEAPARQPIRVDQAAPDVVGDPV